MSNCVIALNSTLSLFVFPLLPRVAQGHLLENNTFFFSCVKFLLSAPVLPPRPRGHRACPAALYPWWVACVFSAWTVRSSSRDLTRPCSTPPILRSSLLLRWHPPCSTSSRPDLCQSAVPLPCVLRLAVFSCGKSPVYVSLFGLAALIESSSRVGALLYVESAQRGFVGGFLLLYMWGKRHPHLHTSC